MKALIQIGCNNGDDHIHKFLAETQEQYEVLLIDANPNSLKKCEQFYASLLDKHSIKFLNIAIVENCEKTNIEIYVPKNDIESPFCSAIEKFTVAHSHSECEKINAKALCINDLLASTNKTCIDMLCIDTEGLCVDILNTLDFDIYDIDKLIFEYIHSDGMLSYGGSKLNKLLVKLKNYNYKYEQVGYNIECQKVRNDAK